MGAIGAALTVSIRRGGLLASLLVIPFYIPVLIFGVASGGGAIMLPGAAHQALLLLGALTLMSLVVGPLAAAAAIRGHLRN
jgi:heme exporter protein B